MLPPDPQSCSLQAQKGRNYAQAFFIYCFAQFRAGVALYLSFNVNDAKNGCSIFAHVFKVLDRRC
jgi:hypothetical protein